jgi:hypothetical protein
MAVQSQRQIFSKKEKKMLTRKKIRECWEGKNERVFYLPQPNIKNSLCINKFILKRRVQYKWFGH